MFELFFCIAVAFGVASVGVVAYEVKEMREQVSNTKATKLDVPQTATLVSDYPPIECKTLVFKIGA